MILYRVNIEAAKNKYDVLAVDALSPAAPLRHVPPPALAACHCFLSPCAAAHYPSGVAG